MYGKQEEGKEENEEELMSRPMLIDHLINHKPQAYYDSFYTGLHKTNLEK